ncbi:MAG: ParB/RepB/Spo0J family partition protein [Caulobacteraceae bacterium]|nr:ParB/RepB/Spo0J family partition protein [Caulobacteraceae bacterium]
MRLAHIDLDKTSISPLNMRHGKRSPDIADLLPSVRQRGVLQPLLVREAVTDGMIDPHRFEVIAGRRRWFAARAVVEEGGAVEPLPAAILEPGDDAAAIEASLIENYARLDPDEVTRWRTFTRLVKEGRSVEDISLTFGVTELTVKRILALGDLLPRIRELYRAEKIDVATVRHLTLATKAQQTAWLALADDPEAHAPTGPQLKAWLFGGPSIPTKHALFDLAAYAGQTVADLFGEEAYFTDAAAFWTAQNEAIAARRQALLAAGWSAVEVLEVGEPFHAWEYEKTPKKKGGKVFVTLSQRGEVVVHEGYLSAKEARRARAQAAKGKGGQDRAGEAGALAKAVRPEVTSGLQDYIDLHRHAAVRATLADHPAVALRLMVAHAIAGSPLWAVKSHPQRTRDPAVVESVEHSLGEAAFAQKRRAALALLGQSAEAASVSGGNGDDYGAAQVFARLLALADEDVLRVLAVVMGETLQAGGAVVEAVGVHLNVDMAVLWRPDDALFELVRDKQVANALLREVGGAKPADGNVGETAKVQKRIVRDFLEGKNGRAQVDGWTPRWLAFPPASYTDRPFAPVARWAKVEPLFAAPPEPQPLPVAAE